MMRTALFLLIDDLSHYLSCALKKDHRFADIVIEIKQTDKMTENQQHAFVRDYFSKKLFLT